MSSDNMYVQYRYMGTDVTGTPNPFLDTSNWQGVDDVLIPNSENLIKGKAVVDLLINKENPSAFASVKIIPNSGIDAYGNLKANDNKVCTNLIKTPCSITVNNDYFIHNAVLYRLDTNGNIVFDHTTQLAKSVKTDTTATNYYALRYVFGKVTDEPFTTETANDIISDFTPALNCVLEDINTVKSDIVTLKRNKTIRLKSWANSSEISAIGEYYWSTVNKLLKLCVADDFSNPSSYINVPLQPDCIYFYNNKIYKANSSLSDLVEFEIESIFGYNHLSGIYSCKTVIGWPTNNNIFKNNNVYATCKCVVLPIISDKAIRIVASQTRNCVYAFTSVYPVQDTPLISRTVVNQGQVTDITEYPNDAEYLVFTVINENVDAYPDVIVYNGQSISKDFFYLYDYIVRSTNENLQLKTVNGTALKGTGDIVIPAGPQGPQGPAGPQGNSGYSGAAGELEVVNNLSDGGATKALSAEMGKKLSYYADTNNLPIVKSIKNPQPIAETYLDTTLWTSDESATSIVGIKDTYDIIHQEKVKSLSCKTVTTSYGENFFTHLDEPINLSQNTCLRYAIKLDDSVNLSNMADICVRLSSSTTPSASNSKYIVVWVKSNEENKDYKGVYAGCFNPNALDGTTGESFDITNVQTVGFRIRHQVGSEIKFNIIKLDFTKPMLKPGVVIIVDNFNENVPLMADYAISKGIKLNLSVIPNWLGRTVNDQAHPSVDVVQRVKKDGHFIFNHTWNHVITTETPVQIYEGIDMAEQWMIANGMSRGCKILSNPSSFYNDDRFNTHMLSNVMGVYHHFMPYIWGENKQPANYEYQINYPYYPADRFINISGLDWNQPNEARVAYFKALADAAVTYQGIAVIGFHGTFWDRNLGDGIAAGDRWKTLVDYWSEIEGINFYTLDEIYEGSYF